MRLILPIILGIVISLVGIIMAIVFYIGGTLNKIGHQCQDCEKDYGKKGRK